MADSRWRTTCIPADPFSTHRPHGGWLDGHESRNVSVPDSRRSQPARLALPRSAETLENIVRLIQGRFRTAVCSVYFLEPDSGELVLGATVGLKPDGVGRVRMRLDEGLTGLVAEQLAPVMVADAFQHPRFKYFPEAGEDPYHSFLGVPLVEGGTLQGVLVVQTWSRGPSRRTRCACWSPSPRSCASLVGDARLLERIIALADGSRRVPAESPGRGVDVRGLPLSPGVGVGQAYLVEGSTKRTRLRRVARAGRKRNASAPGHGADAPATRSRGSAGTSPSWSARTTARSASAADDHAGPHHRAPTWTPAWRRGHRRGGACSRSSRSTSPRSSGSATPFFQERVYDIKDVFHRMLWHLRPPPPRAARARSCWWPARRR